MELSSRPVKLEAKQSFEINLFGKCVRGFSSITFRLSKETSCYLAGIEANLAIYLQYKFWNFPTNISDKRCSHSASRIFST